MENMEKERALVKLLQLEIKVTKEANSVKGESKKTMKEYNKTLSQVCEMFNLNEEEVRKMNY